MMPETKEFYYGIDSNGYQKLPPLSSIPDDYERKSDPDYMIGLKKIYDKNIAKGRFVLILWGVRVEKACSLGYGITILPYDMLEDSEYKQSIDNRKIQIPSPFRNNIFDYKPDAALIYEAELSPICSENIFILQNNRMKIKTEIYYLVLLLTIVGLRAVYVGTMWFEFDDKDIEEVHKRKGSYILSIGTGTQHYFQLTNDYYVNSYMFYNILDCDEASFYIEKFVNLQVKTKLKIVECLYRLRSSIINYYLGEKCVELSIGIESMLGDNEKNEMTHKITTRLVRILGGNIEVRKNNKHIIKKIYGIRSNLVHKGVEPELNTKNIYYVREGTVLFSNLLKKILSEGEIPNLSDLDIL